MTDAADFYVQFVITYNTTRCHNTKGQSLNLHRLESLIFHTLSSTGTSADSFWVKVKKGFNDRIWFAITSDTSSILAPVGIKSLFATTTMHIDTQFFLQPQDTSYETQLSVLLLYAGTLIFRTPNRVPHKVNSNNGKHGKEL
jgi:hypothetical protein